MRPQLAFFKEIDSLHSFRKFSVRNYKSLSKLKLVKQSATNQKIKFHKISLKSLQNLDFNVQHLTTSQLHLLLKRFSQIQHFSGYNPLSAFFILKEAKNIKELNLKAPFKDLKKRFLAQLQHSKIKTLRFTHRALLGGSSEVILDLSTKHLPLVIENISLLFCGYPITPTVNFRFPLSVEHLQNLQKLELGAPIEANFFRNIVKSLQDPGKLKCLIFNIIEEKKEEFDTDEISEFLRKCISLEELYIKSYRSWNIDFYSETGNMKLNKLGIDQFVDNKDIMKKLEELLQHQQKTLKILSLKIMINSAAKSFEPRFWLDTLFAKLKLLKNLKQLRLKITHSAYDQSQQITSALAGVIETLNSLEEIDIEQITADYNNNSGMFEALETHAKSLKSLKVGLGACYCSEKILQLLKKLSKLEHLTLQDFGVQDLKFFLDLRDIVCFQNRNLNSVIIRDVKRPQGAAEKIIEMLKDIINKPTMNEFGYMEAWRPYGEGESEFQGLEVLSLSDVLKEVHHFKNLQIFSQACKPDYRYWDLDKYKWT